MCWNTFCWGGGGSFWPIDQLLLLKKESQENTVANYLFLQHGQLLANLKILGARRPLSAPIGTSLLIFIKKLCNRSEITRLWNRGENKLSKLLRNNKI